MPKPNPSNNMPWPENFVFDFHLSPDTTAEAAEAFIDGLQTSNRNKDFLRLRYIEGKAYTEIGPLYGMTNTGVRLAVKGLWEKFGGSAEPTAAETAPADDAVPTAPADDEHSAAPAQISVDELMPADEEVADAAVLADEEVPATTPSDGGQSVAPIDQKLKPIITAIATTTRQKTFVYDSKTRTIQQSDNVPRGLRRDSRYVPLPDYYQIREYDLMGEFAASVSPDQGSVLSAALGGVGPFKAFRSTVRNIGLGQAWADYRYQAFGKLASEWWEKNVADAPTSTSSPTLAENSGIKESNVLIVDPAALNSIALIETIRVLYRRVGPTHFEDALTELRDCVASLQRPGKEQ